MVLDCLVNSYKRKGIDYLNFGIASFDLAHRIEAYSQVLLIDAINAGLPAGTVKIFELGDIPAAGVGSAPVSSHELNLKDLFRLCRRLGIKTGIYVAGIQVEDISFLEGPTLELKNRLDNIVKEINGFIETL